MSKVNDFLTNSVTVNYPENVTEQLARQRRAAQRAALKAEREAMEKHGLHYFTIDWFDTSDDSDGVRTVSATDPVTAVQIFTDQTGIDGKHVYSVTRAIR